MLLHAAGGGVEDSEENRREVDSKSVCGLEPATSGGDHCVLGGGGVYDPSPT